MKKLLFIFLLLPVSILAQNYSAEVKVPGKNATDLYGKAKEWFAENHKSADNLPPLEDSSKGKIKGSGNFSFIIYSNELAINMISYYALTITVKDGVYNYGFENIMIEHGRKFPLSNYKNGTTREGTIEMFKMGGMQSPTKKMIEQNVDYNLKVVERFETDMERIISSLEDKMKS